MVDAYSITIWLFLLMLIWLPQAIYQLLNWVYWWQVKEYRLDRFWVFLKSNEGREKLGISIIVLKITGLIFGYFYIYIPFFVFLFVDFFVAKQLLLNNFRRPVVTERIKNIFVTSFFGILVSFILIYFFDLIMSFIFVEISLVFTPYFGILWTIPIVNRIKRQEIYEAKKILSSVKPTIIALTGSYGKTTTKDFIAHLLTAKYKVEKTTKSQNTELGIARKIINDFKNDTQVFVVEMGAYKKGEIERLCQLVTPDMGIITGIDEQHIDLFGNIENILLAKYELIEGVNNNKGKVIFNLTNKYVAGMWNKAKSTHSNVYSYRLTKNELRIKEGLSVSVVNARVGGVTFSVKYQGQTRTLRSPVHGIHFVENLACAVLVARIMNVSWGDIKSYLKTINLPEKTMVVSKLKNDSVLIDDSYNSTPSGFKAALDYLKYFKNKKRIVISSGIIELGSLTENIHKNLAKRSDKVANKIIIISKDVGSIFKSNIKAGEKVDVFTHPRKIIMEVENWVQRGSVILLEGRMPSSLLKYLEDKKL